MRLVAGVRLAHEGVIRQIELLPSVGAPVAVRWDGFPGVGVRYGRWHDEHYPQCGCDACDEDPDAVIADLERKVEAVVAGRFTEAVVSDRDGAWLTFDFRHRDGGESGRGLLGNDDPRRSEAGAIFIRPPWRTRA